MLSGKKSKKIYQNSVQISVSVASFFLQNEIALKNAYCGVQNDCVLGFFICEMFTVMTLQDWVGWGIFTVIPGYPRRTNGGSQHLEARPELQGWLQSELFTVKNYRTGPFSK